MQDLDVTIDGGLGLTVDEAVRHLRETGVARWQGFEALYRWFIEKSLQGTPVTRPEYVVPCVLDGIESWIVADSDVGDLSSIMAPDADKRLIKLHSQRGIHKPSGERFAVTLIFGSGSKYEKQEQLVKLSDSTSVILYKLQEKSSTSVKSNKDVYNRSLVACLDERLPVGVFTKVKGAGLYLPSLYFVTDYDDASGIVTLQGPISSMTDARFGLPMPPDSDGLIPQSEETFIDPETRERVLVSTARRTRQSTFRSELLDAYAGRCAVTDYDVPAGLEAAHIWRHFGVTSQSASHGLLLRADIHRMYDAQLCTIEPETHLFLLADSIRDSAYRGYNGKEIRLPFQSGCLPNEYELEVHHHKFLLANAS